MEFLYPHPSDQGITTLLLIVCNRGKSRLLWYEWDANHPLNQQNIKRHSQVLPEDDRMPLLLIPMTKLTAFLLVCENRIIVYTDLFTGTPSRHIHSLSHRPEPEENGTSRRQPIWVQWARAMRSWTHRAQGDGVYLCREDGIVHFLTLKYDRPSLIDSNHQVGRLGTNIDTSFAVLDVGPHSSDLLAVGGDSSDGGLWQFDARAQAKKISGTPNWTPVVDMCATDWAGTSLDSYPVSSQNQRLISCVGKSKKGAILEIRFGIPASRFLAISIKDVLDSGILATWAFRSLQQATSYVILSHPKQSYLLRIRLDDEDEKSGLVDILEDSQALCLKERTIAARATSQGRLIQVTERALWSTPLALIDNGLDDNGSHYPLNYAFGTARVLLCCIELDESQAITLIATTDGGKFFLHLAQVNDSYEVLGSVEIENQPTAVALRVVGVDVVAFVGNSNQRFQIFKATKLSGANDLHLVSDFPTRLQFFVCESIAVSMPLEGLDGALVMFIACGLRNGTLSIFEFRIQKDGSCEYFPISKRSICQELNQVAQMKHYDNATFGNTSVEVFAAASSPVRFIAHCQGQLLSQLFSVECCHSNGFSDGTRIHRICMTDDRNPEWQQGHFSATGVVDDPEASPGKTGMVELVCVDRSYIHVAALDYAFGARNVHRRVGIGGSPVRAAYSKRLHKLIILSNRVEIIRPPRTVSGRTQRGKRTIRPVISFISPQSSSDRESNEADAMEVDIEEVSDDAWPEKQHRTGRQNVCDTLSYEPGERFLGITEWFPRLDTKEFHMLAVNTIIKAENNKSTRGRLLLFSVQVLGDHVTLILKKESAHRAPIYTVAAEPDKNSLVFQCGEDICLLHLEASPNGPKTTASVIGHLRSPARYITMQRPYVYVSTAGDSLAVFRDSPNKLDYCFGDSVARQCLHHINIFCDGRLILTVDMGGSLTGFWQPHNPSRIDNSIPTIFEACLPQPIVRLREVELPLWLQDKVECPDKLDVGEWLTGHRLLAGISACGTISQHKLLAAHQWPLLRFLQNLAETSPIICPFFEGPRTLHLDPDRISNPQTRAINGDILLRLLERGGGDLLRSLMDKPPDESERFLDFDSVEERWARLRELFKDFSTTLREVPFEEGSTEERNKYLASNIARFLRRMLQPGL